MLHASIQSHRAHLRAGTSEPQKLFTLLRVSPDRSLLGARPPLALLLVVDTSGSMRSTSGESKLDRAIASAHELLEDSLLAPDDLIGVIGFDARAHNVWPLSPLLDRRDAHFALDKLHAFGGRTRLALGLQSAREQLAQLKNLSARRVVVLTDGQTEDEGECRGLAEEFAGLNTPLVVAGVGASYNESLLRDLAEYSGGRAHHLDSVRELRGLLSGELRLSTREVLLDALLEIQAVRGVNLDAVSRVYPSLSPVSQSNGAWPLGNIAGGDEALWLLEWTVAGMERPPARARLAQVRVGASTSDGERHTAGDQGLVVSFSLDESLVVQTDPQVLGYVQQKSLDTLLRQAAVAPDPRPALSSALAVSKRLNNPNVTRIVAGALDEASRLGSLAPQTRKSILLRPRNQTVKIGATGVASDVGPVPSDEEIRRITGA
jgi:Ca-activated chloride channel family protein